MRSPLPRLERTGSPVGCSPVPRRPSPSDRRVGSSEKLSRPAQGSLALRRAHLRLGCTKDFPRGFSRTIARLDCSSGYRGVPTTPRTGLPPAGFRDPGGFTRACPSSLQTSFRDALPGTYPGSTSLLVGESGFQNHPPIHRYVPVPAACAAPAPSGGPAARRMAWPLSARSASAG
jgi:hypothetical protein